MNEKWNYALHKFYFVNGVFYSRLESKQVSIDSRLTTWYIKTKIQIKTKTKLRIIFPTSCRHFSLAKFCQVKCIIKKQTRPKNVLWMDKRLGMNIPLILFRMSLFGATHVWGGDKNPPFHKICHISYNDGTWHTYTLPKENSKNIWITWHNLWVLLRSVFFHQKSGNFAISRNIDTDCILTHNF